MNVYKAEQRGTSNLGWLQSWHSFSFADYYNPDLMGFSALRVINDDIIAGGGGFATHPHRDMEIVTYVISGALEHRDSMGNGSVIRAGEVQYMSAGTGVTHSEYNHSADEAVQLLQIWILPDRQGYTPRYQQEYFSPADKRGQLKLIVAGDDADKDVVQVHQDVRVYASVLEAGDEVGHEVAEGRCAWIQMTQGALVVNGKQLKAGDGAAVTDQQVLNFSDAEDAEFLLFDLPGQKQMNET